MSIIMGRAGDGWVVALHSVVRKLVGVEVMLKLNTSTQLDFPSPPLQSGTTARGLVPLIFRVGVWVFLPLWRHTHRHP